MGPFVLGGRAVDLETGLQALLVVSSIAAAAPFVCANGSR
jgi:hypothetical protein